MGVDPQVDELGAGEPARVGSEGDPPGPVDLPQVAAPPGGIGVQVVVGEGRDDPGIPEARVGELAGQVGVAHPLGGAQVQQGERLVLSLEGGVLIVGGHLGDGVRRVVAGPVQRHSDSAATTASTTTIGILSSIEVLSTAATKLLQPTTRPSSG